MADAAPELEATQDANAQAAGSDQRVETAPSPSPDLSAPIVTTLSGRVRKTAQLFTFAQVKSDEADAFTPPVGKGVKVRDVEFIRNNVRQFLCVEFGPGSEVGGCVSIPFPEALFWCTALCVVCCMLIQVEALGKQQQEMIRQLYSIMFGRRFQQKNVRGCGDGGIVSKRIDRKPFGVVVVGDKLQVKAIKEHILEFSGIVEQDEKVGNGCFIAY